MGIQVQTVDVEHVCKKLQRAIRLSKARFESVGKHLPNGKEEDINYWWSVLHFVAHDLVTNTGDRNAIEKAWRDAAVHAIRKYYKQPV